jgi:signal peptidase II
MTVRYLLFAFLLVSSVSCDQGTKIWARSALSETNDIEVIHGFWDFHLAQNPGAAFSLLRNLPGRRYLLTGIGIALLTMLGMWVRRNVDKGWMPPIALGLIAGGAIGNLWDRIIYGSVTDFILWHWRSLSWPVFNVADALLFIGVALLLIFSAPQQRTARTA